MTRYLYTPQHQQNITITSNNICIQPDHQVYRSLSTSMQRYTKTRTWDPLETEPQGVFQAPLETEALGIYAFLSPTSKPRSCTIYNFIRHEDPLETEPPRVFQTPLETEAQVHTSTLIYMLPPSIQNKNKNKCREVGIYIPQGPLETEPRRYLLDPLETEPRYLVQYPKMHRASQPPTDRSFLCCIPRGSRATGDLWRCISIPP